MSYNIIRRAQERIARRMLETKNPCKLYACEQRAEKAAEKFSARVAEYYRLKEGPQYLVIPVEGYSAPRFTVIFDQGELLRRKDFPGGYIGFIAENGFYSY